MKEVWCLVFNSVALLVSHSDTCAGSCPFHVDDSSHSLCFIGQGECGHSFHWCCITKWLEKMSACPLCNTNWNVVRIVREAREGAGAGEDTPATEGAEKGVGVGVGGREEEQPAGAGAEAGGAGTEPGEGPREGEKCPVCREGLDGNSILSLANDGSKLLSSPPASVLASHFPHTLSLGDCGSCRNGCSVSVGQCGHKFHSCCMSRWILNVGRENCPMCKRTWELANSYPCRAGQ